MKTFLSIILLALSFTSSSQWITKNIDNGFDDPYHIAYTSDSQDSYLKLENVNGKISFYIGGGYTCSDELTVDISFIVSEAHKKYTFNAFVSEDRKNVFFVDDLLNESCLADFKACSSLKIRINDSLCETEIYTFNMSGSSAALKYIINQ